MNLHDLDRNIKLHERLDRAYDMVESLREKADVQSPNMDGMPHGTDVADKVGNIAVAIADLNARIQWLEDETEKGDEAVREYANTFEDERIQMAIQTRYIGCFSWADTAMLLGPRYSGKSIRRLVCSAVCAREG